jgi:hypothetical protein
MDDKNTKETDPRLNYHRFGSYDPNHLKNDVTIEALLAMFHAAGDEGIGPTKLGCLKSLIAGRYVEAQMQSMDRLTQAINDASTSNTSSVTKLTDALNKASCSSSVVGYGLIAVGVAAVVVAVFQYFRG